MPKTIFGGSHAQLVDILKSARLRANLTQAEVGARLGRDQTFVSLIERSQRRIDVIEFFEIARALDADPVALFAEMVRAVGSD